MWVLLFTVMITTPLGEDKWMNGSNIYASFEECDAANAFSELSFGLLRVKAECVGVNLK